MEVAEEVQEALENFSFWRIWRFAELNRVMNRVAVVLDDVTGVLSNLLDLELVAAVPIILGNFPPELEADLRRGVNIFTREFREIIDWLEVHAPDATLIVNTVYNPFPPEFMGLPIEMSHRAEALTQDINRVIMRESAARGFLVSDVHASFTGEMMTNLHLDLESMTLTFDFIHPSPAGHELIKQLNYETFRAG
jgi:lysophospholipase L1-like esterase